MNPKTLRTPSALALGAALAGSLAAVSAADASPFALNALGTAYMAADDAAGAAKGHEGKCGEGKCGGDKAKGEGKCGADKAKGEGKCGEGKCGEGKCGADKAKEGEGGARKPT
jgi:uncharacterized low-complexity protein